MAVQLPVLRGSFEGADCQTCPFSRDGAPNKPVVAEFPEDPAFIVIGEAPGRTEVYVGRPFVGETGRVVEKVLGKIGRHRSEVALTNTVLCVPPMGAPEPEREAAASACKGRLQAELARWPGKPVLTLGAIAARSVIPRPVLEAIDPPDAPKDVRKQQKLRQQPALKKEVAKRKRIEKLRVKHLKKILKHHRGVLARERRRKKITDEEFQRAVSPRERAAFDLKARRDAALDYEQREKEKALKKIADAANPNKKPKKPKKVKVSDILGTLFDVDVDGSGVRPLIPSLHPAALLRGGGAAIGGSHTPDLAYVNLLYDAVKVNSIALGKNIRLAFPIEMEWIDEDRAIRLFMQICRQALVEGRLALDLETYVDDPNRHTALMPYVAKIRALGLAVNDYAVSVYWDLLPAWCHSYFQLVLGTVVLETHNGLYDRTVLRAYGFNLNDTYDDTLLMHHAAFPGNAHRLQVVTSQFYGVEPWKSEFRNAEETPDKLTAYNAKDTFSTKRLIHPLAIHVKRTATERVYELDKKMGDIASEMHLAGMPVHRETNSELLANFSKNVAESRRAVEEKARDPKLREQIWHHLALQQAAKQRKLDPNDFEERYQVRLNAMRQDSSWKWKVSAGDHVAALLLAMGVSLFQTSESGRISTKKDVLESLVDVPIVRDILMFRENDKLLSTFIWQIFDREVNGEILQYGYADADDRIHPIWSIHKITGRWASRWPVVSNVPKDKWKKLKAELFAQMLGLAGGQSKFTGPNGEILRINKDNSVSKMVRPNLRAQIRARKGRKLVGFDFSQLEARGIALVSGDPFLLDVFAKGLDIHRECARIIFEGFDRLDPDSQKQIREQTKPMEYGAFYGGSVETLHKQMLKEGHIVKLVDVARAVSALMAKMAGVVQWQKDSVIKAMTPPYEIRDVILGRRRVWPMGNPEATEAMNYGIQALGAAIMNTGMADMDVRRRAYKEVYPIAQIHDAAVFECWEDDAEKIADEINQAFPQEYERDGRTIRFPVETKIADSWDKV